MHKKKEASESGTDTLEQADGIFAAKGREVVRSGMLLLLDRLRFAKKYDAKIRDAICAIEEESELKAAQTKALIEVLKHANVMSTREVLTLVTDIIDRIGDGNAAKAEQERDEVLVTLDERVEKWAR